MACPAASGHRPVAGCLESRRRLSRRDMTITVEAGITLATLEKTLATEGQWLPIDVPQAERATLGGVVATALSGPRRYGYGTMRDYVIGITAVDGRGVAFKGRRPRGEERRRLRLLQIAHRLAGHAGRDQPRHLEDQAAADQLGVAGLRPPRLAASRPAARRPGDLGHHARRDRAVGRAGLARQPRAGPGHRRIAGPIGRGARR